MAAFVADRRGRASREIVGRALDALPRVARCESSDAGREVSDSAGRLTAIPWDLFAPELPPALAGAGAPRIAAMFALHPHQADRAIVAARWALRRLGWHLMAWRDVPMCLDALAPDRRPAAPRIVQCFARAPRHRQRRAPYRTRLAIESRWLRLGLTGCSVTSLSDATIVYKAPVEPSALSRLFPDLADRRFSSAFAVLHRGFGNRTPPRWDLAQPFHTIAHTGEITTVRGNRLWMEARIGEAGIRDETDLAKDGGSDSRTIDAAVQWLRDAGLSTPNALVRLFPPAWECHDAGPPEVRAFHRHEACFAEPWDGTAFVAFADGRYAGAVLGRGNAPPAYAGRTDDFVCAAAEADVFDLADASATRHGRLGPGEMLVADLVDGTVLHGDGVWRSFAGRKDYVDLASRLIHRVAQEALTPKADAQHDAGAVSLRALLGRRGQWTPHGLPPVLLEVDSPVLRDTELEALLGQSRVRAAILPIGFDPGSAAIRGEALRRAVTSLQRTALALAANGTRILVLSDRRLELGLAPLPSIVATVAVDSALRAARLGLRTSIVADAGDIRDAHDAAALCGHGAAAVVPYVLYARLHNTADDRGAEQRRQFLEWGLCEILSQRGVRSFDAYVGGLAGSVSLEELIVTEANRPAAFDAAAAIAVPV